MVEPAGDTGRSPDEQTRDEAEEKALATAAPSETLDKRARLTVSVWLYGKPAELILGKGEGSSQRSVSIVAGQVRMSSRVEIYSKSLGQTGFGKKRDTPDSILNVGFGLLVTQQGVRGTQLLTKSRPDRLPCKSGICC